MSAAIQSNIPNESDVFSQQVLCDIKFLQTRLQVMHAQHHPNQQVINTYEEMLASRIQVLKRLKDEQNHFPSAS